MKNKKIVGIVCGVIVVLALIGVLIFKDKIFQEKDNKANTITDAIKFKEEYEALNNTIRESDGATYNSVTIPEKNPIRYVNCKEALEILKENTAILYIGAEWCPWCRNAVPVLLNVASTRNVGIIYYLNLDEEKDIYEVQDGKLVKTQEGSSDYYALLDFLDDNLRDYVLTDNSGKEYNVGEKRIYIPFVIAAKNGEVVSTHDGTVSLNDDQNKYSSLTEDQTKELTSIYNELFNSIYTGGTCDEECN